MFYFVEMTKGMYLGEFEHLVLLAVLRLRDEAYGMRIRREIQKRTGRDVSIGGVYTTLERLEEKGLVSSRLDSPTAERGGRAKRYFTIEAPGQKALRDSRDHYARMSDGLVIPA